MPELPEVEVVRRGLAAALTGRTIDRVDVIGIHGARAVRRHLPGGSDFCARLAGRTVEGVARRGKYLWWMLDGGDAVLAHLGMSGQFRVSDGLDAAVHPHARIRFVVGPPPTTVDFLDQRTFGGLSFEAGGADLPVRIAHIGRDPLDPDFDLAGVVRRIRASRSGIKRMLLNQSVVSGIGNIYADEALWAAKVRYDTPADAMSTGAVRRVLAAAAEVMQASLRVGGTSFDALYVNVNGESGYFNRSLNVYGRTGQPCHRCGAAIIREPFMNRHSFLCPRCQRHAPRQLRGDRA